MLAGIVTFLSAYLLFSVELLAGKAALPRFGGAPAVWTTSLFFFQVLLLAGYAYSVKLSALSVRSQLLTHVGLLIFSVATLAAQIVVWGTPLLARGQGNHSIGNLEVTGFLAAAVGLPCLALCATAPLVQAWVARSGGTAPWRLYALSNAGALVALVAYPFAIEPLMGLRVQAWIWSGLFVAEAVMLGAAAIKQARAPIPVQSAGNREPVSLLRLGKWILLSAMGTLLLSATSTILTQDVSPGPLMWALPLATYLASFVITFDHERWYKRHLVLVLFALAMGGAARALWLGPTVALELQLAAFVALQFAGSLFCHGELYKSRPEPARLGSYYLAIAFGGALGTLLASVAAPALLSDFWEYPAAVGAVAFAGVAVLARRPDGMRVRVYAAGVLGALALALLAGSVAAAFHNKRESSKLVVRNFLGVFWVWEGKAGDPKHSYVLFHGDIVHGQQFTSDSLRFTPTAYYGWESGLGVAVKHLRDIRQGGLHAAILGLGVGTSAALFDSNDRVDFYEINPEVVRLAKGEGGFFTYLQDSKAAWDIRLGDARIEMDRERASRPPLKDLVAVDTFNGDAIPVHLITKEAVELYVSHLKPDGVLALHISNRHLDFSGIVSGMARRFGMAEAVLTTPITDITKPTSWALMSRDEAWIEGVQSSPLAVPKSLFKPVVLWTDDRNSLLDVLGKQR